MPVDWEYMVLRSILMVLLFIILGDFELYLNLQKVQFLYHNVFVFCPTFLTGNHEDFLV